MASPSIHSPGIYEPPRPYRADTVHLTPYSQPPSYTPTASVPQGVRLSWMSPDPRSSSTQSLVPSESGEPGRRTLLLIYVHGFLGNETSFQGFPAHVHNLLKVTLAETHVIHTKIYPRYKSRKAIEFARDDFSAWLSPHESEMTDVILLGHSMGGILSAEVVLLQPHLHADGRPFRHRVLGTINFDTPFLGMHPGVVVSGIGSLFRPSPSPTKPQGYPEEVRSSSSFGQPSNYPETSSPPPTNAGYAAPASSPTSSSASTPPIPTSMDLHCTSTESIGSQFSRAPLTDSNYNPPFSNDVRLSSRSGWDGALHFVLKHSGSLPTATKTYVMSHLEFGGCLADYPGLKSRYAKIRQLEDVDDISHGSRNSRRVRFVNYYTASTGRAKVSHALGPRTPQEEVEVNRRDMSNPRDSELATEQAFSSPRISVEMGRGADEVNGMVEEAPGPIQDDILDRDAGVSDEDSLPLENNLENSNSVSGVDSTLPPISPAPEEPPFIDASQYANKDVRKLAEKEHARAVKAYKQAVKDHSRAIKDRKKLIEKREKMAKQGREKEVKIEEKEHAKVEKEEQLRLSSNPISQCTREPANPITLAKSNKRPPRDKKFCMLPSKIGGRPDPTWVRVFMEGVDEVGAHCGLFFNGPSYEQLVGDVGSRIENWVREEETRRAIRQLEESNNY